MLLSYRESRVKALRIVIALNSITLACHVTSVLVDVANSAMVKFENFCRNKLIAVSLKVFGGKDASIVVSKMERKTNTWQS